MNTQRMIALGAMLIAGAAGYDFVTAGERGQSQQGSQQGQQEQGSSREGHKQSPFGRVGNQGEGFSEEQTIGGPGTPESTIHQDTQITLGGARPYVEGEILKVNGEDYLIRDASGSQIRVRVNKDTNMVCTGGGQQATMTTGRGRDEKGEIPPTAHMKEQAGQQGTGGGQEQARMGRQEGQQHAKGGQKQEHMGQQTLQGQQILQEQLESRQEGQSSHQRSGKRDSGQRESEGLTGKDFRESTKDKSAAAGAGHLGPQEGPTASSHSGEFPGEQQQRSGRQDIDQTKHGLGEGQIARQGQEDTSAGEHETGMHQGQRSQQAMGHEQPQDQRSSQMQGQQSRSREQRGQTQMSRQGQGQGSEQEGHRIGDQSGTQTRSSLGKDSGGDIARGSGFEVGPKDGCSFKAGDRVRAEVSDLGTVLTMKQITDRDTGARQASAGQMIPPSGVPGSVSGGGVTPGQKAAAQQQAQMMQKGSVPAAPDLQNPDFITRDGKQVAKAEAQQQKDACEGCKVIRGLVLRSDQKSLLVRDSSNKEINLKVDEKTRMSQLSQPRAHTFMEGDRVEALVKPDGIAWSITALKQQQGQPGVAGAPGD